MKNRKQITVRIEPAENDCLKIVWSDHTGARFPPYRLQRQWIDEKAKAARDALAALRTEYSSPAPDFEGALAKVAAKGERLRRALFEDHSPEQAAAAAAPRDWFEGLERRGEPPAQIVVHTTPTSPIPWGLLYEPDRGKGGDPYERFWALRHAVVALYSGMSPQHDIAARSADNVRLLAGISQEVFERTADSLQNEDRCFINKFIDRPVGRAYTSAGCRSRWEDVADNDCIFYFFGNASGSELHFSETDSLTAGQFRALFRRESRVVRQSENAGFTLSFLNGCSSVTGRSGDSFMIATAYPGFCGFIGAEAVVPDRFAMLFGQEFLHGLLDEGLSVRETMVRLWRKHRPMALFYGCYAHPDFSIACATGVDPLPPMFGQPNFYETLGGPS